MERDGEDDLHDASALYAVITCRPCICVRIRGGDRLVSAAAVLNDCQSRRLISDTLTQETVAYLDASASCAVIACVHACVNELVKAMLFLVSPPRYYTTDRSVDSYPTQRRKKHSGVSLCCDSQFYGDVFYCQLFYTCLYPLIHVTMSRG